MHAALRDADSVEIEGGSQACEPRTPPTSTANYWRSSAASRPPSASPPDVTPLRSPRPDHVIHPRAITVADLRAVNLFGPLGHVQLAYWARVATTREAAARRDLH